MPESTSWLGNWSTPQTFLSTLLTTNQPDHTETGGNDNSSSSTDTTKPATTINTNEPSLQHPQQNSSITTTEPTTITSYSLPNDPTTPPSWKLRILSKNELNKSEINNIGDDFTEKAIVRIEGLAEEKREKAADEYIKSTNYIMKGVKNVMDLSVSVGRYF